MDGLITKMQIAGADSKSICRELINGIDEERQMIQREKKDCSIQQNRPKRIDHISTYMNLRILVSLQLAIGPPINAV